MFNPVQPGGMSSILPPLLPSSADPFLTPINPKNNKKNTSQCIMHVYIHISIYIYILGQVDLQPFLSATKTWGWSQ